jgi:alcohol dehydrogenase (NADP+)
MPQVKAYAVESATAPFAPTPIPRRDPLPTDVQIEILFCGICHSDLHFVRGHWAAMPPVYPAVPGHEIVGRVKSVGPGVTRHKVGDVVAVGCMVDSDHTCPRCRENLEQMCPNLTMTYGSKDKHGTAPMTFGGYSETIVVEERMVLKVPANLDLAAAAPLLCAGITTYSPLRRANIHPGMKVGIVGLGGLGHMGVKFAKAFGAHVTVFTTSPRKVEDAKRLGADAVIVSKDQEQMAAAGRSLDYILDCVAVDHDLSIYLATLKHDCELCLVGAPEKPLTLDAFHLLFGRVKISGSPIGGIAETQEMLDFCGKHNITADVEVIGVQDVNKAYERLEKSDVKYRFSIDMSSLKTA